MATCWVPAIRAGPAHEVCLTSKRIIQLFSLFDYGQSPDLPFASEPQCIWPISASTWTQLICCQRAGLGVECLTVASQSTNYSLKDINIWFLYLAGAYWIFFPFTPRPVHGLFFTPIKTQMFYINILDQPFSLFLLLCLPFSLSLSPLLTLSFSPPSSRSAPHLLFEATISILTPQESGFIEMQWKPHRKGKVN